MVIEPSSNWEKFIDEMKIFVYELMRMSAREKSSNNSVRLFGLKFDWIMLLVGWLDWIDGICLNQMPSFNRDYYYALCVLYILYTLILTAAELMSFIRVNWKHFGHDRLTLSKCVSFPLTHSHCVFVRSLPNCVLELNDHIHNGV